MIRLSVPSLLNANPILQHSIAVAVLCLVLQLHQPYLIYQSDVLWSEPWRLWTAHWVHVSWPHAALNLVALLLLPLIFPAYPVRRLWLLLWLGSPVLSFALRWGVPTLEQYAGLSGILHGIYFSAALHALVCGHDRLVAGILWVGLTIKLVLEYFVVGQSVDEWIGAAVLTQAHVLGVVIALLLSCCFGHFVRNKPIKTSNSHK